MFTIVQRNWIWVVIVSLYVAVAIEDQPKYRIVRSRNQSMNIAACVDRNRETHMFPSQDEVVKMFGKWMEEYFNNNKLFKTYLVVWEVKRSENDALDLKYMHTKEHTFKRVVDSAVVGLYKGNKWNESTLGIKSLTDVVEHIKTIENVLLEVIIILSACELQSADDPIYQEALKKLTDIKIKVFFVCAPVKYPNDPTVRYQGEENRVKFASWMNVSTNTRQIVNFTSVTSLSEALLDVEPKWSVKVFNYVTENGECSLDTVSKMCQRALTIKSNPQPVEYADVWQRPNLTEECSPKECSTDNTGLVIGVIILIGVVVIAVVVANSLMKKKSKTISTIQPKITGKVGGQSVNEYEYISTGKGNKSVTLKKEKTVVSAKKSIAAKSVKN